MKTDSELIEMCYGMAFQMYDPTVPAEIVAKEAKELYETYKAAEKAESPVLTVPQYGADGNEAEEALKSFWKL